MQSNRPSIGFRISTIDDHGTAELVRITLLDEEGEGGTLQARKYDIMRAGIKEGDKIELRILPEFEDATSDDIGIVKIRAKVVFITSAQDGVIPDLPESRTTTIFFADWMPWIVNPKLAVKIKVVKELGLMKGDIVKLLISKVKT